MEKINLSKNEKMMEKEDDKFSLEMNNPKMRRDSQTFSELFSQEDSQNDIIITNFSFKKDPAHPHPNEQPLPPKKNFKKVRSYEKLNEIEQHTTFKL